MRTESKFMPRWGPRASFGGLKGGRNLNLESHGVSKYPGGESKAGTTYARRQRLRHDCDGGVN